MPDTVAVDPAAPERAVVTVAGWTTDASAAKAPGEPARVPGVENTTGVPDRLLDPPDWARSVPAVVAGTNVPAIDENAPA